MDKFTLELDAIVRPHSQALLDTFSAQGFEVFYPIHLRIPNVQDLNARHGLNDSIGYYISIESKKSQVYYTFNGVTIDPKCFFIKEQHHKNVDTLTILKLCISENTHCPDIKPLQET